MQFNSNATLRIYKSIGFFFFIATEKYPFYSQNLHPGTGKHMPNFCFFLNHANLRVIYKVIFGGC